MEKTASPHEDPDTRQGAQGSQALSAEGGAPCPICSAPSAPETLSLGGFAIHACPECSLRFAPGAFQADLRYDDVYELEGYQRGHVEALRAQTDYRKFARHVTFRPFFAQVVRRPGLRLLDVGCGVGRFCQAARSLGWDVSGIDLSERAIELGRPYASFPMRAATVGQVADEGERYDVVTAFEVIEHLRDPLTFVADVRRVLEPGGQVFFTVPNWEWEGVRSATRPDWVPPVHLLFFTSAALRALGDASGLSDVRTGEIMTDPLPGSVPDRLRWLKRRVQGERSRPGGLWLHARG